MSEMVERAMLAGDFEDSAQKGEPSPHDPKYFPQGEEGADVFRLERRAVYRAALLAALDLPREEIKAISVRSDVSFDAVCSVLMAMRNPIAQGEKTPDE